MIKVAICGSYPSVVVDDVATFVDLEHGLEFAVDNYVHCLFQCGCKVYLDSEITEAEEGVAFAKVIACQLVACVLCLFTGGGEQVDVASNVATSLEVWLERFGRNLTSVDVDGQEINGVVLGVEFFFFSIRRCRRRCRYTTR